MNASSPAGAGFLGLDLSNVLLPLGLVIGGGFLASQTRGIPAYVGMGAIGLGLWQLSRSGDAGGGEDEGEASIELIAFEPSQASRGDGVHAVVAVRNTGAALPSHYVWVEFGEKSILGWDREESMPIPSSPWHPVPSGLYDFFLAFSVPADARRKTYDVRVHLVGLGLEEVERAEFLDRFTVR